MFQVPEHFAKFGGFPSTMYGSSFMYNGKLKRKFITEETEVASVMEVVGGETVNVYIQKPHKLIPELVADRTRQVISDRLARATTPVNSNVTELRQLALDTAKIVQESLCWLIDTLIASGRQQDVVFYYVLRTIPRVCTHTISNGGHVGFEDWQDAITVSSDIGSWLTSPSKIQALKDKYGGVRIPSSDLFMSLFELYLKTVHEVVFKYARKAIFTAHKQFTPDANAHAYVVVSAPMECQLLGCGTGTCVYLDGNILSRFGYVHSYRQTLSDLNVAYNTRVDWHIPQQGAYVLKNTGSMVLRHALEDSTYIKDRGRYLVYAQDGNHNIRNNIPESEPLTYSSPSNNTGVKSVDDNLSSFNALALRHGYNNSLAKYWGWQALRREALNVAGWITMVDGEFYGFKSVRDILQLNYRRLSRGDVYNVVCDSKISPEYREHTVENAFIERVESQILQSPSLIAEDTGETVAVPKYATNIREILFVPNDASIGRIYSNLRSVSSSCMCYDVSEFYSDIAVEFNELPHLTDAYSTAMIGAGDNNLAMLIAVNVDGDVGRCMVNTASGCIKCIRWYGSNEMYRDLVRMGILSNVRMPNSSVVAEERIWDGAYIHPVPMPTNSKGDIRVNIPYCDFRSTGNLYDDGNIYLGRHPKQDQGKRIQEVDVQRTGSTRYATHLCVQDKLYTGVIPPDGYVRAYGATGFWRIEDCTYVEHDSVYVRNEDMSRQTRTCIMSGILFCPYKSGSSTTTIHRIGPNGEDLAVSGHVLDELDPAEYGLVRHNNSGLYEVVQGVKTILGQDVFAGAVQDDFNAGCMINDGEYVTCCVTGKKAHYLECVYTLRGSKAYHMSVKLNITEMKALSKAITETAFNNIIQKIRTRLGV